MVSAESIRDFDIHTFSDINSVLNVLPAMYFVVTGSYSIEALIEKNIPHNDLDTNILTTNLTADLSRAPSLLMGNNSLAKKMNLIKNTEGRLEYDIVSLQGHRRLEMQFIEIVKVQNNALSFDLKKDKGKPAKIYTVLIPLSDSTGKKFVFRTKSLSYTIATWAIRISGAALNPKRVVKESDVENFRFLLDRVYSVEEVLTAIRNHIQMPANVSSESVFSKALEIVDKGVISE